LDTDSTRTRHSAAGGRDDAIRVDFAGTVGIDVLGDRTYTRSRKAVESRRGSLVRRKLGHVRRFDGRSLGGPFEGHRFGRDGLSVTARVGQIELSGHARLTAAEEDEWCKRRDGDESREESGGFVTQERVRAHGRTVPDSLAKRKANAMRRAARARCAQTQLATSATWFLNSFDAEAPSLALSCIRASRADFVDGRAAVDSIVRWREP
jgi:hypothetical protein